MHVFLVCNISFNLRLLHYYDENIDFVLFYIFIDLYRGASDLSISANIF